MKPVDPRKPRRNHDREHIRNDPKPASARRIAHHPLRRTLPQTHRGRHWSMHPLPKFRCRHFAPQTSEFQTPGLNGDCIPETNSVRWDSIPCKIKLLVCSVPNGRGLPVSTNATRMILSNEPCGRLARRSPLRFCVPFRRRPERTRAHCHQSPAQMPTWGNLSL
jgi:hypothetical protein